jgi:cytidylate kinase
MPDAVVVDTSERSIGAVVEHIRELLNEKTEES